MKTDMRIYNPEGSRLRHDQLEMIKVMQVFSEICKENDIKWWLCSGTLLGAVRHGGFIPWDDDVDVSMLEKDYRKLQKVLKKLGKEDEYFFQSIQTDPDHYYRFGKFLRKGDSIPTYARFYQQKGIGLDVFYIVKSSQFAAHMGKFFYLNMVNPAKYMNNTFWRHLYIRFVQVINFGLLLPLTRLIGLINPKNDYHYQLGTGFYNQSFHVEEIFPLTTIKFEGVEFPAPKDMDSYLTRMYGDWRTLPSEDDIRRSIHSPIYRKEIYGEE